MPPHVAIFPFPFASHPILMLGLVRNLAQAAPNVQFSFFNTSDSNKAIFGYQSKAKLNHNIKAYNIEDGVPVGHALSGNPREPVEFFLKAAPGSFKRAMDMAISETGLKISCLISDALLSAFLKDVLGNLCVPWIAVWCASPYALSSFLYAELIKKRMAETKTSDGLSTRLDFIPGLCDMKISDMCDEVISDDLQELVFCKELCRLGDLLPQATAVTLNSYREITSTLLSSDFESKFQTLLYVGFPTISFPLPPLPPSDSDQTGCLSWLDEQKARSVVYISFGTEYVTLLDREMVALVEALEENKIPFLWSIKESFKKLLPDGFVERTSSHGKIVPWAPQSLVLAHESIGAHLTHSGYNSMNESFVNGVPLICRPIWADNRINARMIESVWGIGVKVEEDGFLTKSNLVKSFQLILGEEQGEKMREKAHELKQLVLEASGPNGSGTKDFETLVGLVSGS
ncbi:hypothetical protein UlMin_042435 [Ulmus minor]